MTDQKNRFGFRNPAGNEGFSRFVAPPKPAAAETKSSERERGTTAAGGTATTASTAAQAKSQELVQGHLGGLGSGLMNTAMVVNVGKMALLGMLGGALYGLAKGTAENQGVLYELKYKTVAFDMDPFASQLFHRLGKFEHLQPESYKLAIHYCDKLFLLERNLASVNARPSDTDIPMAQSCIDAVLGHVMLIRNHAQNGTQRGEINIIKENLNELMSSHRSRIFARASVLRS